MKLGKVWVCIAGVLFLLIMVPLAVNAEVPHQINYQGYLTDHEGNPLDESYSILFSIYDVPSGGDALWYETKTVGVVNGNYSVQLGQSNFLPSDFFDGDLYLSVKVGSDPEMTPRVPITSVAFALKAEDSETLNGLEAADFLGAGGGTVTGDLLVDGKMGIGTSSPLQPLDIYGDILIGGGSSEYDGSSEFISLRARSDEWYFGALNGSTQAESDFYIGLGYADGIFHIENDGDIGIGTTSPTSKLDVRGTITVSRSVGPHLIIHDSNFSNDRPGIQFTNNNIHYIAGDDGSDEYFGLYSEYSNNRDYNARLRVHGKATDNWGRYIGLSHDGDDGIIDTDVGDIKFQPAGNDVQIEGSSPFLTLNTTNALAGLDFKQNGASKWRMAWNSGSEYLYFWGGSGAGTSMVIDDKTGNIGMGNANPEAKLDVGASGGVYTVYGKYNSSGTYGYLASDGIGAGGVNGSSGNYGTLGGSSYGVYGKHDSTGNYGYLGSDNRGVAGVSNSGIGVFGSGGGYGVWAQSFDDGTGLYARGGPDGYAAAFRGNVRIFSEATNDLVMELGEGLDYAEGFDVSKGANIKSGDVLIIDPDNPGKLALSKMPYDTKVAGIAAGAKGLGSGVRLGGEQFDQDVALAGRVYCNVDASEAGVEPGDMLTTSSTPGYAQKSTDYMRAQGAILGKAMERLEKGQKGQILVLVTLQ